MHQGFGPISSLHRFTEAESPSIGLEIAQVILFLGLDERGYAAGDGLAFGEAPLLLVPDALVEEVSGDPEDDEEARQDGADGPRSPIPEPPACRTKHISRRRSVSQGVSNPSQGIRSEERRV